MVIHPLTTAIWPTLQAALQMAADAPHQGPTDLAAMLAKPQYSGLLAQSAEGPALGYLLWQQAAETADIIHLWVSPAARRQGVGMALLQAFSAQARAKNITEIYLEVAVNNPAATALYQAWGAQAVGRRPRYYPHPQEAIDALVFKHSGPF